MFQRYDEAMYAEVEQSRQSAARLLDSLRRKLRRNVAARNAAHSVERAARYVQVRSARDGVAVVKRFVRREPVVAISIAVAAGFLLGKTVGRKV